MTTPAECSRMMFEKKLAQDNQAFDLGPDVMAALATGQEARAAGTKIEFFQYFPDTDTFTIALSTDGVCSVVTLKNNIAAAAFIGSFNVNP